MTNPQTLLRVIVGSNAHGLATPDSDMDFREVVAIPTVEFLHWERKPARTIWREREGDGGTEDTTGWEIGEFIKQAIHGVPVALEMLNCPVVSETDWGKALRGQFRALWGAREVHTGFRSYVKNQRVKMFGTNAVHVPDVKTQAKYACAGLRVLYQGTVLLSTGELPVNFVGTEVEWTLRRWKELARDRALNLGEVINVWAEWEQKIDNAVRGNFGKEVDSPAVEQFLMEFRRENFYSCTADPAPGP